MAYHILTFGGIVAAYWLARALTGKGRVWRVLLPELLSQVLFAVLYLSFGLWSGWDIFLALSPAAGVWVSYLCFAADGAARTQGGTAERRAYHRGLAGFALVPVATALLPPFWYIWREILSR